MKISPAQASSSVASPEQGILPPVKLLVLNRVASLSQIPMQVSHGSQAVHDPSTAIEIMIIAGSEILPPYGLKPLFEAAKL